MRALAFALGLSLLLVPAATANPSGSKVLARYGNYLTLVGHETTTPGPYRPLAFSGDGRLYSVGGKVLGGIPATLPTRWLAWAPTGERAAYVTSEGAVVEWTPATGKRYLEPKGWGANWWWSPGAAWSRDGAVAVARGNELWVIRGRGAAERVAGPLPSTCCTGGGDIPVPFAWVGDHVLWWDWPDSGSIAADGVSLHEDGTKLGTTLMYRDYVAVCGTHVAFAMGGRRESTDNKTIVFDGRDVSHDPRHSWASPACTPDGRLVASASRNDQKVFARPHRSIWQLLPVRKQLTHAPWGWSDEDPRLLPDGSLLFVRSRLHAVKAASTTNGTTWLDTTTGRVMVLAHGKLSQVATIGYRNLDELKTYLGPYFGHYDWSQFLAVWP
jgi:hypothetical protein